MTKVEKWEGSDERQKKIEKKDYFEKQRRGSGKLSIDVRKTESNARN